MQRLYKPELQRAWRVFYTYPRSEKKCEERLLELGLEVFLPKYEQLRYWKTRKHWVSEPLFRSYIFAYVNERERIQALMVDRIAYCLSFGGRISEITEHEIEQLRIMQNDPRRIAAMEYPRPDIGKRVTIVTGPMQGLQGEVVEHRGTFYVIVRLEEIRQAVRVHVPSENLRILDC